LPFLRTRGPFPGHENQGQFALPAFRRLIIY
jgi:hypothetical protein